MSEVTLGVSRQETIWTNTVKIDGQINERLEVIRFQSGGYRLVIDGDWKNAQIYETLQELLKVLPNTVRLLLGKPGENVSINAGGGHPRASEFSLTHCGIR